MSKDHYFWQRFFYSKLFIGLLIIVIFVLGFNLFAQFSRSNEVEDRVDKLKQEINKTEKENVVFSNFVGYLKSDLFVEKEARIKLGLTKPGESVVIIENSDLSQNSKEMPKKEILTDFSAKTNLSLWRDYFFKRN